jgi:hypothetical protein
MNENRARHVTSEYFSPFHFFPVGCFTCGVSFFAFLFRLSPSFKFLSPSLGGCIEKTNNGAHVDAGCCFEGFLKNMMLLTAESGRM